MRDYECFGGRGERVCRFNGARLELYYQAMLNDGKAANTVRAGIL
jgi:hypothetical protein